MVKFLEGMVQVLAIGFMAIVSLALVLFIPFTIYQIVQ